MTSNNTETINNAKCLKIRHGELAYRKVLGKLSTDEQRVLFIFESGGEATEAIHALAWKYHKGKGFCLAEDEIRAGEVEFVHAIRAIRKAIDEVLKGS